MTEPAVRPAADLSEVFEEQRPRLLGLAYRTTGSLHEAEDIVQDAWLRFDRAGAETIERPAAWLTTVVSRLALDRLRSARHTRETYVGPWLPEPIVVAGDPAEQVERRDSLAIGFLLLLERLGPVERVVFVLADVFGVPFDEIAETVDRSPAACRQVASRARQRVQEGRRRFATSDAAAWEVALAFFAAAQAGDIDGLVAMLANDSVLTSDGGANRRAARRPVVGPDRIGRLVINLGSRYPDDLQISLSTVNGAPGLVATHADGSFVVALGISEGQVHEVHIVMNPDKLAHLGAPATLI